VRGVDFLELRTAVCSCYKRVAWEVDGDRAVNRRARVQNYV
jgi:hypothetical protein